VRQAPVTWDVDERLGSPEGRSAIAQAVVYLATVSVTTGPSSET
jgi:replication-associated recombination protein RarA